jgi:hypothetical protein
VRADRVGERPQPRKRTLTLNAGFFVGVGLVMALAWWIHGDAPPGLRGEPDFTSLRGQPFLVVYGAPSCQPCVDAWPALRERLPKGLRVVHLLTRDAGGPLPDATMQAAWAARLGVPRESVLPADLVRQRLPAVVLRDARARWRFEHGGAWTDEAGTRLDHALRLEGVGTTPAP